MMYETIYKALLDVGLEEAESPQDYLNFFCLGNRENTTPNPKTDLPNDNTPEVGYKPSNSNSINQYLSPISILNQYLFLIYFRG